MKPDVLSRKLEGAEAEFEMDTPGEEPGRYVSGPEGEGDDPFLVTASARDPGKQKRDTREEQT